MNIKHITVKNFRCFGHLEFDFNPDLNIFAGNNGSGKSAVLDVIAFSKIFGISLTNSFVLSRLKNPGGKAKGKRARGQRARNPGGKQLENRRYRSDYRS